MDVRRITLSGRVVRLEPLAMSQAEDLVAAASPEIFTNTFPPPEFSPAGFQAVIGYLGSLTDWCPFAIVSQETGKAVGMTCFLDIRPRDRNLEIGFTWIAKALQGTAVNPECKYLLLQHAFEDQHAIRVQLKTDSRNQQSQRAIEKLGAVREGILRRHMIMPDGYIRDTVMYSITDEEWPAVKERLETRLADSK
ncbi:MAG TPA: GNAT family protein [Pirellulales bacterium]|jgi:RimJ/RimL family protein N-acetyltransferase